MIIRGLWAIAIVIGFVACEQEPEIRKQVKVDNAAVVPDDSDANGTQPEVENEEVPAGEIPAEPAAFTFADFDAMATQNCANCHGATSGRVFLVNDEENVKTNAANIRKYMNDDLDPMPQSGLLSQEIRDKVNAYLDAIPAQ